VKNIILICYLTRRSIFIKFSMMIEYRGAIRIFLLPSYTNYLDPISSLAAMGHRKFGWKCPQRRALRVVLPVIILSESRRSLYIRHALNKRASASGDFVFFLGQVLIIFVPQARLPGLVPGPHLVHWRLPHICHHCRHHCWLYNFEFYSSFWNRCSSTET